MVRKSILVSAVDVFSTMVLVPLIGVVFVFNCAANSQEPVGIQEPAGIRVLIVYSSDFDEAEVKDFENRIKPTIDEIARGAKLTKADATRKPETANNTKGGIPIDENFGRSLIEWARTSQPGDIISVLVVTGSENLGVSAKVNCGDYKCPVDCRVNNCRSGWDQYVCCNYCKNSSFCCGYTCVKHIDHAAWEHRSMAPKTGSTEPIYLLFLLARSGIGDDQVSALEKFGLDALASEPFPDGLTIKSKRLRRR